MAILGRISDRRAPQVARTVAVCLAVAALAAVSGCTTTTPEPGPSEPTPTGSSTPTAGSSEETAVYYTLDTRTGFRLARESRDVPAGDVATGAVEAMIAGPQDPDYATTWDPGTTVLGVTVDGGVVSVDLSADARTANVGSELAALMIQQLVYTVTSATEPDASVELLIEGEPAGELWGAVVWDSPVGRDDPLDVVLLVQIDQPREGATVTSPVTVSGEAVSFEANVPWRVLDSSGAEVQTGNTMTSDGTAIAPFSFDLTLDPGTWTIEISEDDPSDGAAGTPMTDTRTFTVTG